MCIFVLSLVRFVALIWMIIEYAYCCMCIVKYADIHWSISFHFHRSLPFERNVWYSITWSHSCVFPSLSFVSIILIGLIHPHAHTVYQIHCIFFLIDINTNDNVGNKTNQTTLLSFYKIWVRVGCVYINIVFICRSIEEFEWFLLNNITGWIDNHRLPVYVQYIYGWCALCKCLTSESHKFLNYS